MTPSPQADPVPLADVTRSGFVESVHYGSVIALGPDGAPLVDVGATRVPVFPRSSNKPMQALAALHAGLDVAPADLALVCGSHRGEPEHVERALALLARNGLGEDDLQCPPDLPGDETARRAVLRAGGPERRVYMNCSGKHSGMLAACVAAGWPTATYRDPDHPLQQLVRATIGEIAGEPVAAVGVDGCGAPVMAVSLEALARAFGRLAAAAPGTPERRIADAMRAHPHLVGGSGQDDTVLMAGVPGLLMKGGAEGVHAAGLPDGTGIAVKISDGSARARMPVLCAVLRSRGVTGAALDAVGTVPAFGGGRPVGEVRVRPGLSLG